MSDPQIPASVKDAAASLKPTPYDWREPAREQTLTCRSCQSSRSFMVIFDEGKARAVQCSVCLKAYMLRSEP